MIGTSTTARRRQAAGAASGSAALELDALCCSFGQDNPVVKSVDLKIRGGEFFSLLGPSGCGKTTTLRMIAGLERATSGRVLLDGVEIQDAPAHKRPVHTVFQSYALFPHLSVYDNVAFGLKERRAGAAEIKAKVSSMLELVELGGREALRPRQLSGGMQQRVALARSLVLSPRVLLLDEPLGALDLRMRRQMQVLLKSVQHELGITFVYVTHDQEEAFAMSDRVGIMQHGELIQVGGPQEVYHEPATLFAANFVGASNTLAARVTGSEGGRYDVELPGLGGARIAGRGEVTDGTATVILRPETVLIEPSEPTDFACEGTVEDVSFLGAQTSVRVGLPDGTSVKAETPSRNLPASLRPGETARLGWQARDLWLVTG
ncbi:ABC transporter ATP-binding protein [Actinocorallia sp. A-T 12471]|uniref:ABC transporter ATP-binding protein n=1 Tax=Actinocorallia sp. A-T 12471 TaxID=3089813 RepID=UPI0029CC56C8|nr:ABC transporter ATP-binding protein [Actinocorallia sp. A-T 12471]MDX6742304.1 ABC transporter ATP-binding protein [Actinocorallia sp. A-T 12471]